MPTSKLDKYLNILEVLVARPQKTDYLSRRLHTDEPMLKRHLTFLVSNGVVEKRKFSDKLTLYAVSERGVAVFKTLRALKYLEKLRDTLPAVEEAREIAAVLSKRSKELKEA